MEVDNFGIIKHHQLVKEYTQGFSSIFDLFDESLLVALFFEYSDVKTILNVSYTCHTFHDLFHSKIIRKWFGFMGVTSFYIPRECRFLFLGHCKDAQANQMQHPNNESHSYAHEDRTMQEINPQFFVCKTMRALLLEPDNRKSNCICWEKGIINTPDSKPCLKNPWCCNNRLLETLLFDPDKDFDVQINLCEINVANISDPNNRHGVYLTQFWLAALAYVCRGGIKTIPKFVSVACHDLMSKFFLATIARVQTVEMTTNHMEKFWRETKKELLLAKLKECRHQDKRDDIMKKLGSIEMVETDVDMVVLLRHLQILYSAEIGAENEHKWLQFDMKKDSLVEKKFVPKPPSRKADFKDSSYIEPSDMARADITIEEIADEIWWSTKIMQMVTGKNVVSDDPAQPKDQRFDQTVALMLKCVRQLDPHIGNLERGSPAFDILGKMDYNFDPAKEDYVDFFHRVFRPLFGRMLMRVTRKLSAMSTVTTYNPVYRGFTGNADKPKGLNANDVEQLRRCYVGTSSSWFPDEMLDYLLSQINTQVLGIKDLAEQFTGDELKAKINAEVEAREGPLARYNPQYIPLLNRGCMDRIDGRKCLPRLIDFIMDVWEEFAIDLGRAVPLEYPAEIFCMAYVPKPHSIAIKTASNTSFHHAVNDNNSSKLIASMVFLMASRKDIEFNQHFHNCPVNMDITKSITQSDYGGFRHCNMYTMLEMKRFFEVYSTSHFTERNLLFGMKNRTKTAKLIVDHYENDSIHYQSVANRIFLSFADFSRSITLSSDTIQSIEISVPSCYWNHRKCVSHHNFGMLKQLKELKLHGVPAMFDGSQFIDMLALPMTLEVLEINCTSATPADSLHDIDPWSLKDSFSGAALLNLLCPRLKRLVFIGTDLWSILNYPTMTDLIEEERKDEPVGMMFKHLEYLELGYTNCQIHVGSFFSPLTQSLLGSHDNPDFFTIFPSLKTLVLSDTVVMGLKQRVGMGGKPDILLGESLAMVMRTALPKLNRLILCGTSLESRPGFRCSDGFYQRLTQTEKPVLEEVRFNISRYPYDLPQGFFNLYDTKALALYNQYRVEVKHEQEANDNAAPISFLEQLNGSIHLERLSYSEYNKLVVENTSNATFKWWKGKEISFPNLTTYVHQGTKPGLATTHFHVALELAHLFPSLTIYKFKPLHNDKGVKSIRIISREWIDPITREARPEIRVQSFPDNIETEIGYGLIGSLHGDRWRRLWSLPRTAIQNDQGQLIAVDLDEGSSSSSSSTRYPLLLKLHDVWKSYQMYMRRFGHHCYHHCINVPGWDKTNEELNTCQSVAGMWDKGDNAWYAFNTFTTMFGYYVANEGWNSYINYLEYLKSPSRWSLSLAKKNTLLFLSPSPILTEPQAEKYHGSDLLKLMSTKPDLDGSPQWTEMASMGDPYWATPDTVEEMEQTEETLEEMYEKSEEAILQEPSIMDLLTMDVSSDSSDDDDNDDDEC